jgi:hypothetical protein
MSATTERDPDDKCTGAVAQIRSPGELAGRARPGTRQPGLLRHLAGVSLGTARTRGVACAVGEVLVMANLLREFRVHLLAMPVELRGDGFNPALALIEQLIAREAFAGRRPSV